MPMQHIQYVTGSPGLQDNIGTTRVRDTICIITMIGGPNTTTSQRQTTGGIPNPYQIQIKNDSATVVINALEYFSAKQVLAQSTLNAIQEFDGSDRESTLSWLVQVQLVAERTGFDPL